MRPLQKKSRIIKEYKLSEDLASQIVRRLIGDLFENIVSEVKVAPTTVASVLVSDLRDLKREGIDISLFNDMKLIEIFKLLESGKISKDALKDLMVATSKNPDADVETVALKTKVIFIKQVILLLMHFYIR